MHFHDSLCSHENIKGAQKSTYTLLWLQIKYIFLWQRNKLNIYMWERQQQKYRTALRMLENTQENTILILLHYIITKALWNQLHKVHKTIIIDFYTHGQICSRNHYPKLSLQFSLVWASKHYMKTHLQLFVPIVIWAAARHILPISNQSSITINIFQPLCAINSSLLATTNKLKLIF